MVLGQDSTASCRLEKTGLPVVLQPLLYRLNKGGSGKGVCIVLGSQVGENLLPIFQISKQKGFQLPQNQGQNPLSVIAEGLSRLWSSQEGKVHFRIQGLEHVRIGHFPRFIATSLEDPAFSRSCFVTENVWKPSLNKSISWWIPWIPAKSSNSKLCVLQPISAEESSQWFLVALTTRNKILVLHSRWS